MKICRSIRTLYDDQKEKNGRLKIEVDKKLNNLIPQHWHYVSRIKELESYALKIETGRFNAPESLEDFFACSIVVRNSIEISEAIQKINEKFLIISRRPNSFDFTHKKPEAFPFDDLRLYCKLKENLALPSSDVYSIIFEVQIKTFLQHAWSIATHDLIYKTDQVHWGKERIAYQIKAMLEHAETSINQANQLATAETLAKENIDLKEIKGLIQLFKEEWEPTDLPSDIRRLAENTRTFLSKIGIDRLRLQQILRHQKSLSNGQHPKNLSPYITIVQYCMFMEQDKTSTFLMNQSENKFKVLIPEEMELPQTININQLINIISI